MAPLYTRVVPIMSRTATRGMHTKKSVPPRPRVSLGFSERRFHRALGCWHAREQHSHRHERSRGGKREKEEVVDPSGIDGTRGPNQTTFNAPRKQMSRRFCSNMQMSLCWGTQSRE